MIGVTRDGCVTFPLITELSVTASCSAANYVPLVIRYPRLDLLALPDESGKGGIAPIAAHRPCHPHDRRSEEF